MPLVKYFRFLWSCNISFAAHTLVVGLKQWAVSVHLYLFSFITPHCSLYLLKRVAVTQTLFADFNSLTKSIFASLLSLSLSFCVYLFTFPDFQRLPQSGRVSQGLNGDLYFSNVMMEDSRSDYICYARFPHTQTIQQKQPISVRVLNSESLMSAAYICRREAGGSFLQ